MKILILISASFLFVNTLCGQINPEDYAVIRTDRQDGRYLSTRGFIQHQMRNLTPLLAFNSDVSAEMFATWKVNVANKVNDLMRFPIIPPQPIPLLVSTIQREGYRVEKWEIYPQPGSVVPILMLIPDYVSATDPAPAVICYPGTSGSKESLAGESELNPRFKSRSSHYEKNHMAKIYAQKGIIAIAIDHPFAAEASDLEFASLAPNYQWSIICRRLMDMGWHFNGLSAFNGQQVLNWLKTLPIVDDKRIALSGHSLGTEPVMLLAVLNPGIKAVVFNDFLTNTIRRAVVQTKPNEQGMRPGPNGIFSCIPGMWHWFDYADLLGSLAPMELLITEGGVTMDLETVKNAYDVAGASESFVYRYYELYKDPANRIGDVEIPEGINEQEWFKYANVDAPNHYFKADIAVPWLLNVLFEPKENSGNK